MSLTETDICNSALIKVGASRITSLDDDSEPARLVKEQYPKVRDALLRSHPWNFCIDRMELAADLTAPIFGFGAKYQVPSYCLRVLNVWADEYDWQREGDFIVTDAATVKIRYIKKITDTSKYDATFAEALSLKLSADISYSLVQSLTFRDSLVKDSEQALRTARSFDAQEGTAQRVVASDWLDVRY